MTKLINHKVIIKDAVTDTVGLAHRGIPKSQRGVSGGRGEAEGPLGVRGQTVHISVVILHDMQALLGACVPQADGVVPRARQNQPRALSAPHQRTDVARVA